MSLINTRAKVLVENLSDQEVQRARTAINWLFDQKLIDMAELERFRFRIRQREQQK